MPASDIMETRPEGGGFQVSASLIPLSWVQGKNNILRLYITQVRVAIIKEIKTNKFWWTYKEIRTFKFISKKNELV